MTPVAGMAEWIGTVQVRDSQPSTVGILGRIIFVSAAERTVLCTLGCTAVSWLLPTSCHPHSQMWQPKMFPETAKCPQGTILPPVEKQIKSRPSYILFISTFLALRKIHPINGCRIKKWMNEWIAWINECHQSLFYTSILRSHCS